MLMLLCLRVDGPSTKRGRLRRCGLGTGRARVQQSLRELFRQSSAMNCGDPYLLKRIS